MESYNDSLPYIMIFEWLHMTPEIELNKYSSGKNYSKSTLVEYTRQPHDRKYVDLKYSMDNVNKHGVFRH